MVPLYFPGTMTPWGEQTGDIFSLFETMLSATGGLSLSQVCVLTNLESSTVQNWVKRGWVAKPVQKKYHERQLARILLISALRGGMQIEQIVRLLCYLNGNVEDSADDIIKESQLYNYLCMILQKISEETGFSKESVITAIRSVTAEFSDNIGYEKLIKALCIMVYACIAGNVRTQAEWMFRELEI